MTTEVKDFKIDGESIIARSKERGEGDFIVGKKQEAIDKFDALEMPKPDKTRINRWDFFTVSSPVVNSEVFESL